MKSKFTDSMSFVDYLQTLFAKIDQKVSEKCSPSELLKSLDLLGEANQPIRTEVRLV